MNDQKQSIPWGNSFTALIGLVILSTATLAKEAQSVSPIIKQYCVLCHNDIILQGGMSLQHFDADHPELNLVMAEKMILKLRAGMMPPQEAPRPDRETLQQLAKSIEIKLDRASRKRNDPGTRPFQRLNRAEYAQQIKDVLGLTVNPAEWLPEDQISASFDNIADVQTMSPTAITAYLTAASDIARRAIGQSNAPTLAKTYTNSPSVSQHEWEPVEGAPYGTRGGISALHNFPADGEYIFKMGFMSGWGERYHDIDISVDGERLAVVQYGGEIDFQGRKKFPMETNPVFVRAGERRTTATFIRQMEGPYEDLIRPNDWSLTGTETSYGTTSLPHLIRLTIEGPYNATGVSETRTRKQIFTCRPTTAAEEVPCAQKILSQLATKAYGRTASQDDIKALLDFYSMGAEDGGFEIGVRTALEAILSSPHFLLRMEREPNQVAPGDVYTLDDMALAKRLSFFIWGTNPDAELLELANRGKLSRNRILKAQVLRMLADPRSEALATRFASLWLRLQDLEKVEPDAFWFPNYSQQLMTAMRRETELFFYNLVREDRSMLELYNANYSFMNERLAQHYGIPNVLGEEFRRVEYTNDQRRGILGHGSILVQTSLGNRTSPVLRGKWVLEVLLGAPPPPPPPGIPDLEETVGSESGRILTTRERLEMHRSNPVCAACHRLMDPIGLALDNFDVTGKWRIRENDSPLDTRSIFYDGTPIATPADLSQKLLQRPIPLVRQFTQNLMAFGLGRRIEAKDQPTIRKIVAAAEKNDYRMSSFVLNVVMSDEFRKKKAIFDDGNTLDNIAH
ncbi:MAG TPA: DUF1592 domain-containing protein [Gammaproteobacteria bacterium]|nr:DUF1592 domain-containing protein [Gammaproteobacteria bacterium]